MRKALFVSVVVFVLVVTASAVVTWFLQSAQIEKSAKQVISTINAQQPYITYESITTSGFPSNVVLTIKNPRFSGRVDELLAGLAKAQNHPMQPMPQWNEDITLDGTMTLGINALSDRYILSINGLWHSNSKIADMSVALASQTPVNAFCVVELSRAAGWFGSLWNVNVLTSGEIIDNFRSLDCSSAESSLINANTNDVLVTSGPQRFYALNMPEGGKQQFRFYVKSADTEVTPAGDAIMNAYLQALSPEYPFPSHLSAYGKQNMDIDMSYNGPVDWKNAFNSDLPFDLSINKLEMHNQIYNTSGEFHFAGGLQGREHLLKLILKSESTFSEAYDVLMQETMKRTISNALAHPDPQYTPMLNTLQKHSAEDWYTILYPALPNFHSLGKLVLGIEGGFKGERDFSAGEATLGRLEISASPYGLTGNGTFARATGQMFPSSNTTLVCTNCLRLVDDAMNYKLRLDKVLTELSPAPTPPSPANLQLTEGIKAFLSALAETTGSATDTTFTYVLVSDASGTFSINGKKTEEVMALYNQYVAPFLPALPPAAAQPLPPTSTP